MLSLKLMHGMTHSVLQTGATVGVVEIAGIATTGVSATTGAVAV